MYDKLLEVCGFEPEEIAEEMPRIERALRIIGIDETGTEKAVAYINQYFDPELIGFRKLRAVAVRELANLVLAREENEKVVYFTPTMIGGIESFMLSGDNQGDVYCQSPDLLLWMALGGIFGPWSLIPLLEAAEENGMRAGQAHCGAFQFKIGALAKEVIPKPDLLFTMGGMTCTQAGGADTLAHELFDIPVAYVDGTDYPEGDTWPEISPRHITYAAETMRRCEDRFAEVTGVKISAEAQKEGLVGAAKTLRPLLGLTEMRRKDPVPVGFQEVVLSYYLGVLPMHPDNRKRAIEATGMMAGEVKQRVENGQGIAPKGTPRIFFSFPPLSDASLIGMVEKLGIVISGGGGMNLTAVEMKPPTIPAWEERSIEGIYRKGFWHNGISGGQAFLEQCRYLKVDGVVVANTVCCRLFNPCTPLQKELLEKELGIPVLALESDVYDTRNYSTERLRSRMEAFAEIVKETAVAKH
ncbi:MAG: 2-hydroxyacyl-CoA dehydratase family protein [Desulfatiglans sp.]|jgi:hypothetical protein|nr:2-hydroxyacyl-CoA dehydratase family protein [Desulfatiglans sp.]